MNRSTAPSRFFRFPRSLRALRIALCVAAPCANGMAGDAVKEGSRVVLVHGIFQNGMSFTPLARKLESRGCECLVARLKPADARLGLEPLAEQLKMAIEQKWGQNKKIHIVAHSMGGLISRYYLQNLGGHRRCQSLTTLASPHHGTVMAWCYPGKGAGQMRPGSAFLKELQSGEERLAGMELRSFYTPMDLIILPYQSSKWRMADNQMVYAPAHPLVMFSPRAIRSIVDLTCAEKAAASK